MAGEAKAVAARDSARLAFERIEGELDAALVFALAADESYRSGNMEYSATCLSDAKEIYRIVLAVLPGADLTGAQFQRLKSKLKRLRHLLDGFGVAATVHTNEAA